MKLEKDTSELVKEGSELNNMIKSDGWAIAKKMLFMEISALSDILSINERDPEALMREVAANQQAIKVLLEWVRKVENKARTVEEYKESILDIKTETYIKHYI